MIWIFQVLLLSKKSSSNFSDSSLGERTANLGKATQEIIESTQIYGKLPLENASEYNKIRRMQWLSG